MAVDLGSPTSFTPGGSAVFAAIPTTNPPISPSLIDGGGAAYVRYVALSATGFGWVRLDTDPAGNGGEEGPEFISELETDGLFTLTIDGHTITWRGFPGQTGEPYNSFVVTPITGSIDDLLAGVSATSTGEFIIPSPGVAVEMGTVATGALEGTMAAAAAQQTPVVVQADVVSTGALEGTAGAIIPPVIVSSGVVATGALEGAAAAFIPPVDVSSGIVSTGALEGEGGSAAGRQRRHGPDGDRFHGGAGGGSRRYAGNAVHQSTREYRGDNRERRRMG